MFLGAELVLATGVTKMDELLAALRGFLEVNPDGQPDRGTVSTGAVAHRLTVRRFAV